MRNIFRLVCFSKRRRKRIITLELNRSSKTINASWPLLVMEDIMSQPMR